MEISWWENHIEFSRIVPYQSILKHKTSCSSFKTVHVRHSRACIWPKRTFLVLILFLLKVFLIIFSFAMFAFKYWNFLQLRFIFKYVCGKYVYVAFVFYVYAFLSRVYRITKFFNINHEWRCRLLFGSKVHLCNSNSI